MTIEIRLLGTFEVRRDGRAVPASAWSRRHAAALVKLLALSPGRRLHREQVIDALWPDLAVDEAAPRLHKAAHFARKAAGDDTIVLRGESVALFPDQSVAVDVALFEAAADEALRAGDEALLQAASDRCGGDLLPEDLYEEWADGPRQRVRQLRTDLLRRLHRWDDLVQLDGTDEEAHLELMRALTARGDRHGALRQFERLDRALAGELGVAPSKEAVALRDTLLDAGAAEPAPTVEDDLVGRDEERTLISTLLGAVGDGQGGRTLLLAGAAGAGKSALLAWARGEAESRGWRTGRGRGRRHRRRLGLRADPGGRRRSRPAPSRPARRARRQLPGRDRAGPGRCGPALERRRRTPAALRGRRRAAAARRRRPRRHARARRPSRSR